MQEIWLCEGRVMVILNWKLPFIDLVMCSRLPECSSHSIIAKSGVTTIISEKNNMETLKIQTISSIESAINIVIQKVIESTGSLHTKDDVRSLLINLENKLIDELGQVFDNAPVVENFTDQRFTLEEVLSVIENLSYSEYTSADTDSAEFELSYRNQIELNTCDVEFDEQEFYKDVENGLTEMLEEKQKATEVEVAENTIS